MITKPQARRLLDKGGVLEHFMPVSQRLTMIELMDSAEGDFFIQKAGEMSDRVRNAPVTYETESVPVNEKVICLHYFGGGVDAWIIERDVGDSPSDNGLGPQEQAYGKVTLMGDGWAGAEWGYVSIRELIQHGIELDLHFEPTKVGDMK